MKVLTPFLVLLALFVAAVISDRPQEPADLVFVNRGECHTLDPQRMSWLQDFRIAQAVYEGLVRWDNDTFGDPQPAVAESWEVSADALVYTFHLRDDARWSNGDPVVAGDFVYSWRRALMPDTAAEYSDLFYKIKGGEAFFNWRAAQLAAFAASSWLPDNRDRLGRHVVALVERFSGDIAGNDALRNEAQRIEAQAAELVSLERSRPWDEPQAQRASVLTTGLVDNLAKIPGLDTLLGARRAANSQSRLAEARMMLNAAYLRFERTVGLQAPNDQTLRITLQRPTPYMFDLFSFGVFYPVHPPSAEAATSLDLRSGSLRQGPGWTRPPKVVSNGPYRLTLWRYKRDMRMEANPYYWNKDAVQAQSVLALSIEDPSTAVLAYESGSIDWLSDVSVDYRADMLQQSQRYIQRNASLIESLRLDDAGRPRSYNQIMSEVIKRSPPRRDERTNIHKFQAFGTYFFNFNCSETLPGGHFNPFKDARVRRAFTMALDKRAIVERVTRLNQPVATTFIPPGSIAGFDSPAGLPYDPAGARSLLRDAGWSDRDGDGVIEDDRGRPFPVVEVLYATGGGHDNIAQACAAMWEKELGVRTSLIGQESKITAERKKNFDYMISQANWYGDYGDPTTFLDLFKSSNNNNDRNYRNPTFDAMMERADSELEPTLRMSLLHDAERYIVEEELPLLPLFHRVTVYMYEPDEVAHISEHPRLVQYLWEMKVTRR